MINKNIQKTEHKKVQTEQWQSQDIRKTSKTNWEIMESSNSKIVTLSPQNNLSSDYPIKKVEKEVVKFLLKIQEVEEVKVVVPQPLDPHWIDFVIQLKSDLTDTSWEQIHDLVIDCEWDLRDRTEESWYFNIEFVESFNEYTKEGKVIFTSNEDFQSSRTLSKLSKFRKTA